MKISQILRNLTLMQTLGLQDKRANSAQDLSTNAGFSLVKLIATMQTNALEATRFKFADETLNSIQKKSRLLIERRKVSRDASINGIGYIGMFPLKENPKPEDFVWRYVEPTNDFSGFLEDFDYFNGYTGKWKIHNNETYPLMFKYYKTPEGIMYREYFVLKVIKGKEITTEQVWSQAPILVSDKNGARIPIQAIRGNELSQSNIEYGEALGLLNVYQKFMDDLWEEHQYTKASVINNENFSDKTPEEIHQDKMSGLRVMNDASFNSKLQQGTVPIFGQQGTITTMQSNIMFLEDKILKSCGVFREVSSSGKNQHSLEIATINQQATEFLLVMQDIRQEDYQLLFDKSASCIGITAPEIKLEISTIEQIKIDNSIAEGIQRRQKGGE